ncbi:MAG: glycoside hydrolase family 38 C-terminal domain-containing protein, partial [Chloroflexota bacterium]
MTLCLVSVFAIVDQGNIERPTHLITSFDAARFEVPAHWWMDMSESGYGVALLNDCKYGHEAHGHWMRLTLLKGSISPDPHADREEHFFTYMLVPHLGDWRSGNGNVQAQAHRLNMPLQAYSTTKAPEKHSYIHCPANNITLEAVKQSEDGNNVILRLVERENQRTQTQLVFDRPLAQVVTCDLMENEEDVLAPNGNEVTIHIKPREILTLAITFAN